MADLKPLNPTTGEIKRMYVRPESFGFVEIEPYEGSEIPPEYQKYWVFMER